MLEQAQGLTDAVLEAISSLERRALAADGGRLKLEWGELRNRSATEVRDLLWWEDGELLGFLGLYGRGRRPFELAGMVDPGARRRGIGRTLLEAALPICESQGGDKVLLVVPRVSQAGADFARSFGMTYEHSEHALRLSARPDAPGDPALTFRQATAADIPELSRLYDDGFHDGGHVDESRLLTDRSRTLLIDRDGAAVGTIVLASDGARGAIYAFVVASSRRGQGIGGQALRLACHELFSEGVTHVELEVAVENEGALGLYTKVGFEPIATEDYYELILS